MEPVEPSVPEQTTPVTPTRFRGLASFAAMHKEFPCGRWLTPYRDIPVDSDTAPTMSVLWGTFGEDLGCIKEFLKLFEGRPHLLQIHFSNEACRRNERCKEGEFERHLGVDSYNRELSRGHLDSAVRRRLDSISHSILPLLGPYSELVISRGLEDNLSESAAAAWTRVYREHELGSFPLVASAHAGARNVADIQEYHSETPPRGLAVPCIANEDGNFGQDAAQSRRFAQAYSRCNTVLFWRENLQGLADGRAWEPPRDREFTLSDSEIQEMRLLFLEQYTPE